MPGDKEVSKGNRVCVTCGQEKPAHAPNGPGSGWFVTDKGLMCALQCPGRIQQEPRIFLLDARDAVDRVFHSDRPLLPLAELGISPSVGFKG